MMTHQFEKYLQLGEKTYFNRLGKVVKIVGLTIESVGPDAKLNDLCRIVIDREQDHAVMEDRPTAESLRADANIRSRRIRRIR